MTIELDGNPITELLLCETEETLKLVWLNDWYEGEEEIRMLGFRPICDFRVYGAPLQFE